MEEPQMSLLAWPSLRRDQARSQPFYKKLRAYKGESDSHIRAWFVFLAVNVLAVFGWVLHASGQPRIAVIAALLWEASWIFLVWQPWRRFR
jgi:hypothetical protein